MYEKYQNCVDTELTLVSSLPFRNKTLLIAVKNYVKADIKIFCSSPILLDLFLLCFRDCSF